MKREGGSQRLDWITSARQLVDHLQGGGSLLAEAPVLRLGTGEAQYAHLQVHCSRYLSSSGAPYNRSTVLGFGNLTTLTLTAIGSAAWNSHKRRQAEMADAAQWRPLGWLEVVVTSERILVREELTWRSIWLGRIVQAIPQLAGRRLDVLFEEFPALRFDGPSVPYLAVMLHYLLGVKGPVLAEPEPDTGSRRARALGSVRCP